MSHVAPAEDRESSSDKLTILRDRAAMLAAARQFFSERAIVEVDCPACTEFAPLDAHIDLFKVVATGKEGRERYLHSSPEYGMKRLLAMGSGDIYQLSHVFRAGEVGRRHNPEFMMAEWYRCGLTFEAMIRETGEFITLFCGQSTLEVMSYRDALKSYVGIDYTTATRSELLEKLAAGDVAISQSLEQEASTDDILNLLMSSAVEPHLGIEKLTAIVDYPATQGALAETIVKDGIVVARRFEIYHKGYELANGYQELRDSGEQRRRFLDSNDERLRLGREALPIDVHFLEALERGLPDCCGVAVGFDRLMMIRHNTDALDDVVPFSWHSA